MRFKELFSQRQGVLLLLVGCISSVWLASTKQLNLYIHPRYIIFTASMAIIGIGLSYISFRRPNAPTTKPTKTATVSHFHTVRTVFLMAVYILAALSLLIVKPATLTTSTVQQRGVNSSVSSHVRSSNIVSLFGGSDYTSFTVKDWAALLVQTNDPSFFTDKTLSIVGFISPDADDPQHVFYVSRFVITCCAVDAQPVGVPVYMPNWQTTHAADQWVRVEGTFVSAPGDSDQQRIVVKPAKITSVEQPEDPYVY